MVTRHLHLSLILAILATGCVPGVGTPPKAKPTTSTATGPSGQGLVGLGGGKLIALDRSSLVTAAEAGLIGNDGGSLITNDGGSLITNDGGSLITNDGGSLITNDGGSLIGNDGAGIGGTVTAPASLIGNDGASLIGNDGAGIVAQGGGNAISDMGGLYHLAQAAARPVKGAYVYLRTADGKFVTDAKGNLLATKTNAQGRYAFGNLVARHNLQIYVALGARKGAAVALQAFLTKDSGKSTTNLDAYSTLYSTYVAEKIVKAQADPRASLDLLKRKLDTDTRAAIAAAFAAKALDADRLTRAGATQEVTAAETSNAQLHAALDEVKKALTLGQANLGSGLQATQVGLFSPRGLVATADGGFYVAESGPGRIRKVNADGTISTYVDANFGQIKANYLQITKLALGPDGSLYVASKTDGRVRRLAKDGTETVLAGVGSPGRALEGGDALASPLVPNALTVTKDGKVYVAEGYIPGSGGDKSKAGRPRLFLIEGGKLVEQPLGRDEWSVGQFLAIAAGPDGSIYAMALTDLDSNYEGRLVRQFPDGHTAVVDAHLKISDEADLAVGPDGTVYVTISNQDPLAGEGAQVLAIKPDGTKQVLAGAGGPAGTADLVSPGSLSLAPDGTIYVIDTSHSFVRALKPGGGLTTVAGALKALQTGDLQAFSINGPSGAVFDEHDNLLVTELGSHRIVRFDGANLEAVAGTTHGYAGDGGPANQARLAAPTGLARFGQKFLFLDIGNHVMRSFTPGGKIETVAGTPERALDVLQPGVKYDPAAVSLQEGNGLALDAQGRPYWTGNLSHQLVRLVDGKVELVAGKPVEGRDINVASAFTLITGSQPAETVPLAFPAGLCFEASGDLLLCDSAAGQIYRVKGLATGAPTLTSIAGVGMAALTSKVGGASESPNDEGVQAKDALMYFPMGLAVDPEGNIYVSEGGTANFPELLRNFGGKLPLDANLFPRVGSRVRKISAKDGTISTVAGPGSPYFANPKSLEDSLVLATGLAIDSKHRLAIMDSGSNIVRILPPSAITGAK